jgi:arylsulfatase
MDDNERRPNILFFHVDNLGAGEIGCYSGGPYRGTWTERIDSFAGEGFRLTNYAPEGQCTPTRSALLTGRYSIRSGNHSVPLGGTPEWGLVAWERTIGDVLSAAGYRCAAYGKWHVGEGPGHWPTDHGFEECTGRRAPTTRHCGRPTPGSTPNETACRGWSRSEPVSTM